MREAFEKGGDFHSRTAMGMYGYIRDAIADGTAVLEAGSIEEGGDGRGFHSSTSQLNLSRFGQTTPTSVSHRKC